VPATAILLAVVLGVWLGTMPAASAQETPEKIAVAIVGKLVAGQFAEIAAELTPEMAKALPGDALKRGWDDLTGKAGRVRDQGTPRSTLQGGITVVTVPVQFEKAAFDVKVSIAAGKVAGLFIVPAEPPAAPWSAAQYVDPSAFVEVEVEVGKAPWTLPGTLSLPRGRQRVPAVVLVHGSGPNDRDETIGPNRPFQDLAQGLASRGIAVLRYEKRTKAYGPQLAKLTRFTVREETVEDAVAAVALLRSRAEIDPSRVVVLGHSLGGTLAPRIAKDEPGIAALVIMAGAARPIYDLLIEQLEYIAALDGPPDAKALEEIAKVKSEAARARIAKADDNGPAILHAPPAYWADLNAYDAAATAGSLTLPMLILQGGRDYQVTAKDLDRFKVALAGHANVTIQEFPRLNHLFIAGDGKSRPEDYNRLGHVDAEVIEAVAAFVNGLAPR
jgi:dienelactone hydrolase